MMKKYNFIDLFAGCGGLSEGFYRVGYNALSHVEINHAACNSLKSRMKYYGYEDVEQSVLEIDITRNDILELIDTSVNGKNVDIIIGGPPCQAYSSLGRAKDEKGMKEDPRNYLFESYVKVLNYYKPKIFVFENVTGMLTAKINGEKIANKVFEALGENYQVNLDPNMIVLNSADYGVPQIRKRVIIIGVRKDLNINIDKVYDSIKKTHSDTDSSLIPYVTVYDAIYELPKLLPGEGNNIINFTSTLPNEFIKRIRKADDNILRDHIARKHNEIDKQRYKEMSKNKWTFKELLENRPDLKHENPRVFSNSYTVQVWDKPARTIIAHLYKDGNQFIHPDHSQERTISVREAARLQSFPDDFVFEGSRTEQYKQIGNAVPPLFAEAIAKGILSVLVESEDE